MWYVFVEYGYVILVGCLGECIGQLGFVYFIGVGDYEVMFVMYLFVGQKLLEQCFVQVVLGFVVYVFGGSFDMVQVCCVYVVFELFGFMVGCFLVNEQIQLFGMGQIGGFVLVIYFGEGFCYIIEFEVFELIKCWVCQYLLFF